HQARSQSQAARGALAPHPNPLPKGEGAWAPPRIARHSFFLRGARGQGSECSVPGAASQARRGARTFTEPPKRLGPGSLSLRERVGVRIQVRSRREASCPETEMANRTEVND